MRIHTFTTYVAQTGFTCPVPVTLYNLTGLLHTCAWIKPAWHAPFGFVKPLQVPVIRWSSLSMDYITGLPKSDGYNAILVLVHRLTKMPYYIPTCEDTNSELVARLYFDNIFCLLGLSDSIVSNWGTQVISAFSRTLCKLVHISQNISTSFHPQIHGQTKCVNAILEQYLWVYINYKQDNWYKLLTMAWLSYNNTVAATTEIMPFFALYGQHTPYIIKENPASKTPTPAAPQEWANYLKLLNSYLRSKMTYAQAI